MDLKIEDKLEKSAYRWKEDKDIWWRYVSRPIAVFICKNFLLKTPITANQITIIGTIISIIATYIISFGGYMNAVIGCLIFQISLVLDCADGTVARHRKTSGIFGVYLEDLTHKIVPTFLMFGLAMYSYTAFGDFRVFYILGITIAAMYLSAMSRSSKTEVLAYHMSLTGALPAKFPTTKLLLNQKKSVLEKIVFIIIEIFNSPGQQQTLLLIVAFLGYIQYAIFFFFVFYSIIAMFKVVIEYKSGFKIYGMER